MNKRPLHVEDFARLTHSADPQLSPDGRYLAFVVVRPDLNENKYNYQIWIINLEDEEVSATLSGEGDSCPRWSPDSKALLFLSRRDFKDEEPGASLYIFSLGGEPRKLLKRVEGIEQPQWISGSRIGFIGPKAVRTVDKDGDYVKVLDLPAWFDGKGFVDEYREALFLADASSGLHRALTKGGGRVTFWSPSPDGKRIAYLYTPSWREPLKTEVHVVDLTSGEDEVVIPAGKYSFRALSWNPDGRRLALQGHSFPRGISSHNHVWVLSLEERAPENLTLKLDRNTVPAISCDALGPYRVYTHPIWAGDDRIYFLLNEGGRAGLYRADPATGEIEPVLRGKYTIFSFALDKGANKVAYLRTSSTEPPEIWLCDLKRGEARLVRRFNAFLEEEVMLSKPLSVKFKASDGREVEGWYLPPLSDGGKKPAVLFVHGGPKSSYGEAFNFLHQLLAAKGFYVIYCNPRGSDGYDEDFADIRGQYGTRDYADLMEFVDEFLKRVQDADPNKLGVTGISYGGFMTNWIVTRTDRFKAAISENGICDWTSDYGTSDIGYWFNPDQIGGDPRRNREGYLKQSPINFVERVKTPIMLIHSMEDYRCTLDQSLAFHAALRCLGKESRLVIFKKGSHGHSVLAKPRQRRKRYELIIKYFEEKLKRGR